MYSFGFCENNNMLGPKSLPELVKETHTAVAEYDQYYTDYRATKPRYRRRYFSQESITNLDREQWRTYDITCVKVTELNQAIRTILDARTPLNSTDSANERIYEIAKETRRLDASVTYRFNITSLTHIVTSADKLAADIKTGDITAIEKDIEEKPILLTIRLKDGMTALQIADHYNQTAVKATLLGLLSTEQHQHAKQTSITFSLGNLFSRLSLWGKPAATGVSKRTGYSLEHAAQNEGEEEATGLLNLSVGPELSSWVSRGMQG